MGAFRTYRRWGGLAALVALTLQLVLSFGHVHALAPAGPTAIAIVHAASPTEPAGHDDDAGRFCDICATLSTLSTAQAASPPTLIVPVAFTIAPTLPRSDSAAAVPFRAAFRSRAPPAA